MTFLTSMAILVIASALSTWINDHTKLGGDYMTEDELKSA